MGVETSPRARVPWRSKTVQIVLASTLLAPLGVPLVSPALPVIRDAFGVSDAVASLLISAYFVVGVVLSPFIGALVDRIGRKRVLVASLFVFGIAGGATTVAPNFLAVLALRVVQGTAAAGIFITTVTIIGDTFEGVQRNAVLGVNTAVLSVGAAVFPVVGGALASISWDAPFLAYLAALPLALVAWSILEEPPVDEARSMPGLAYFRRAVTAISTRRTGTMYLATFLGEFLVFGAVFTALPFLLASEFALGPLFIGLVLMAGEGASIVAAASNGRLATRFPNRTLVAAGFACFGLGFVGAWLAPTPLFVVGSIVVVGVGIGLVLPSVDAEVTRLVPAEVRAGALSLRNSTTFLGRASGPVVFASLALVTGYPALLLASGLVALAGALVAAVANAGTTRRRVGGEPTSRESSALEEVRPEESA
ncbi:MAG: MFS transporter [Halobacteriota archaeon]